MDTCFHGDQVKKMRTFSFYEHDVYCLTLSVNYRGSSGFGQDSIDSLPGNIGTQDVKDVQVGFTIHSDATFPTFAGFPTL